VSALFTWDRFAAIQIWIFVLFLVYTSIVELNAHLGNGELVKIFITGHSTQMKPTRPSSDLGDLQTRPASRESTVNSLQRPPGSGKRREQI
jgi:hypothetical protein